jgi:uncharacterized protein YndB with AHSA1/START domain
VTGGTSITLEFRTELAAAPEQVFAALTDGDRLRQWFCDAAVVQPGRGGSIALTWDRPDAAAQTFRGRWVVFEAPLRCAYEGGHDGYPDGYAGRIGFELSSRDPGTVLHTRHVIPGRPDYVPVADRYRAAWPRALDRLVASLAASV